MNDNLFHVMRMTVGTDVDDVEPDYRGSFSTTFRVPPGSTIVSADWSAPGEVTLTYLIPGPSPYRPEEWS